MMQNEKPTIESICEKSKALPQPESVVDNSEKRRRSVPLSLKWKAITMQLRKLKNLPH